MKIKFLWSRDGKCKLLKKENSLQLVFIMTNSSLFLKDWRGREAGQETSNSPRQKVKQNNYLKTKILRQHFNVSALCGYLDLAIIGKVSQGSHDLGHSRSQRLLHCLLLSLGDSGEAWQQVDQVGSRPQVMEEEIRMQTEQSGKTHLKLS